jgi:hypothetical protein
MSRKLFMPTNLIPAAAQTASDGSAQVNLWLHGFLELAKICVIFAGGYFSHWLLLRRDVSGRKRAFRAFMAQLRSETADRHHPPNTFAEFYENKVPNLRHAAASIADDFPGDRRDEFERLVSKASGFTGAQAANPQTGKKHILEAIDAIIQFIDT